MFRYTSLQSYRLLLKEFNLPSLSLLHKITQGKIDAISTVKALHGNGIISKDVILIFDEIYLQKGEEFVGGELVTADEDGELYKGIVSFMIVGLTQNIPYVFKALSGIKISGE